MKNSFVMYTDYAEQIELLTMEQRGILLTVIMNYVSETELPDMDGMVKMAFSFIKSRIDRDFEKYNDMVSKRREAGKMGGRPKTDAFREKAKKANGFPEKQTKPNESKTKQKNPDNDNVNDNDNEKDNKEILSGTSADRAPSGTSTEDETKYPYKAVIDYLNQKAGTSFRASSKDNRKHIKARVDDGFKLEDFCSVIDKKVSEWGREPAAGERDMRQYLRPMTLFGPKFESYLNQKPVAAAVSKNKFNNFEQRQYDHASLEQQLLARQGMLRRDGL